MQPPTFNWALLLTGIQFLLGLQLIVVAGIHLYYRFKPISIPLGWLCLIHGLWFFKPVFVGYWNDDLLLFLLIGPGKPIFAGAILLFYYKLYSNALTSTDILKYLAAPATYYVLLIIFRFFLIDNPPVSNEKLSLVFTAGVFFIFWYYFFITRRELKQHTRQRLIPKAYRKVMILFYSLYFFLLQVPVWDMLKHLIQNSVLPVIIHDKVVYLYETIFLYLGEYLAYGYLHLLGYFLFLYALSEVTFLKQLFLPKDTLFHPNTLNDKARIDHLFSEYFHQEKNFKNPDLTLDTCAVALGITKKELTDYLKLTKQGGFNYLINKLRVEEFKLLVPDERYAHYDLVGLAKECGFTSKSTFFRVFKEMEGLTPNQFKNGNH